MRQKKVTKEEVLKKASQIIKEEGLEACTMRKLATALGIAVGTLYNYFSSHDQLLKEIFVVSWSETIQRLVLIEEEVTLPELKIQKMFRVLIEEVKNRRGLGQVVFKDNSMRADKNPEVQGLFESIEHSFQSVLGKCDKNHSLDEVSIAILSRLLLTSIIEFINRPELEMDKFQTEILCRFI